MYRCGFLNWRMRSVGLLSVWTADMFLSVIFSLALTNYEAWDGIDVGTIPYELFNLQLVTLQQSGTNFKIGMNAAKGHDRNRPE